MQRHDNCQLLQVPRCGALRFGDEVLDLNGLLALVAVAVAGAPQYFAAAAADAVGGSDMVRWPQSATAYPQRSASANATRASVCNRISKVAVVACSRRSTRRGTACGAERRCNPCDEEKYQSSTQQAVVCMTDGREICSWKLHDSAAKNAPAARSRSRKCASGFVGRFFRVGENFSARSDTTHALRIALCTMRRAQTL